VRIRNIQRTLIDQFALRLRRVCALLKLCMEKVG
jgi:hypothetical protein